MAGHHDFLPKVRLLTFMDFQFDLANMLLFTSNLGLHLVVGGTHLRTIVPIFYIFPLVCLPSQLSAGSLVRPLKSSQTRRSMTRQLHAGIMLLENQERRLPLQRLLVDNKFLYGIVLHTWVHSIFGFYFYSRLALSFFLFFLYLANLFILHPPSCHDSISGKRSVPWAYCIRYLLSLPLSECRSWISLEAKN